MKSRVQVLAKKTILTITLVVEPEITQYTSYGSDQVIFIAWIKCILFGKHFSFLSVVFLEIAFSNILQNAKFQRFLPLRLNHGGPSAGTKASKFLLYDFSRYNSRKLFRIL